MEWSNEAVIEFLELVEAEPSIWNPKHQHNKNRNYVNDAWARIRNSFSLPLTVEQLKRKRNSLLTQYRYILRRMKGSTNTDSEDENVKPKWFAFDVMHSYLGALYEHRSTIKSEEGLELETSIERPLSHESDYLMESNTEITESGELNNRSETPCYGSNTNYEIPKKRRRIQVAKKQMDDPFSNERSNRNTNEINECNLYGQLLAEKLKPLQTDHRMILMNEIDNLVFKYIMRVRKGISTEMNSDQLSQPTSRQDPLNLKV